MGRRSKGKRSLDHNILPENFRSSTGPNQKISTSSGLSTESSPDLGMNLLSVTGQN